MRIGRISRRAMIASALGGVGVVGAATSVKTFLGGVSKMQNTDRMPVLFIGHGTPMNAVESNQWTNGWSELGQRLPRPSAILSISAHWLTNGGTNILLREIRSFLKK
jgi:hypothetical protein